jgi:hypothetical protein
MDCLHFNLIVIDVFFEMTTHVAFCMTLRNKSEAYYT